jgi:fibronectin-binding autotransporter adhesin
VAIHIHCRLGVDRKSIKRLLSRSSRREAQKQKPKMKIKKSVLSCALFVGMIQVIAVGAASAQTIDTWTGANASTDWATAANWTASTLPVSGNALAFGVSGTAGTTLADTLTNSSFNINGIYFLPTDTALYSMSGNAFNLTAGITVNPGLTQTFANNITDSAASSTFTLTQNSSNLTFTGSFGLSSSAAQTISFYGFNNNSSFTFDGGTGNFNLNGSNAVTDTINAQEAKVILTNGANIVTGSGGILFNGTRGALLIFDNSSTADTYTGGTTVVSGAIVANQSGGNGIFGTGAINIGVSTNVVGSGVAAIADTAAASTFSNAINVSGGSLNVIEDDSNSNNNTFNTGTITLIGGTGGTTLNLFDTGNKELLLQNNIVSTGSGGGNLTMNFADNTATTQIVLSGSVNNSGTISNVGGLSGAAAGAGTIISGVIGTNVTGVLQNSAEPLALTNTNLYTGATTVNGGTLNIGNGGTTGAISASSALVLGGGTLSNTRSNSFSQAFNGTTINAGASAVSASSGDTISLGALTQNVGGAVNYSSTGTITTSTGNNTAGILGAGATYGTGTSLQYATVSTGTIGGLTGTAAATAANVTDNTGAVNYDLSAVGTLGSTSGSTSFNTIRYLSTGTAGTIAGNFTANGLMNNGGALVYSGNVTIGADTNSELVITGPSNTTLSGSISNNGGTASALTMAGTGTLTLGGAGNYTGQTTIGSGTVLLSGGTLGSGALVFSNNAAALNLNGTATSVASLAGGGILGGNISDGSSNTSVVLTTGTSGATTYAGVISNGTGTGTVGLTVNGSGTLILTGANTYTGTTTIASSATLQVGDGTTIASTNGTGNGNGASSAFGEGAGSTNGGVTGGTTAGTLSSTTSGTGATSIVDNGSLVFDTASTQSGGFSNFTREDMGESVTAVVSGGGSVTLLGGGTLSIYDASNNSFTGGLNIKAGTVNLASGSGTFGGSANGDAGKGTITIGDSANTGAAATLAVVSSSGSVVTYQNAISVVGTGVDTIAVDGDTNTAQPNVVFSGAINLVNNSTNNTTLTVVNNEPTANGNTTGITLSGNITGTGNLVLQSTNSGNGPFAATITVSGASTGVNNTGTITNNAAGTTVSAGNMNTTIGDVIGTNVTGVIENSAASNLILTGANLFTSQISVQQGLLAVEHSTGSGGLSGSNAVVLGNSTGNTTGIFQLGSATAADNETVTNLTTSGTGGASNAVVGGFTAVSTLTVNPSGTDTFNGTLGGAGTNQNELALIETGTGTLNLNAANTYIGGTTISAGTLLANNTSGSALGTTGAVSVTGTLGGGNGLSNSNAPSGTAGGSLAPLIGGASLQNYAASTVGVIGAAVTINSAGTLTPGNGGLVGTLSFSSGLTLSSGANLTYAFNGTANSYADVTAGGLTLTNSSAPIYSVDLLTESGGNFTPTGSGVYNLIGYNSVSGFNANSFNVTDQEVGYTYTFTNDTTDDIIQLDVTAAAVPEPSTWAIVLAGLGCMAFTLHRRRQAAA